MPTCPICHSRMYKAGAIRPGGRGRLITVYMCHRCGYRRLG